MRIIGGAGDMANRLARKIINGRKRARDKASMISRRAARVAYLFALARGGGGRRKPSIQAWLSGVNGGVKAAYKAAKKTSTVAGIASGSGIV